MGHLKQLSANEQTWLLFSIVFGLLMIGSFLLVVPPREGAGDVTAKRVAAPL